MNVNVNLEVDLESPEIQEKINDAIIKSASNWFINLKEEDKTRILTNISYQSLFKAIDESLDDKKSLDIIKEKTLEIINGDGYSHYVFREPTAWTPQNSTAYSVILNIVRSKHELINEKIDNALENLSNKDLRYWILKNKGKL